jgi:hypothetical protein
MLQIPRPAIALVLADLRARFGTRTGKCSRHLREMEALLSEPRSQRVVVLGSGPAVTAMALQEARGAISALCAVCGERSRCKDPLIG